MTLNIGWPEFILLTLYAAALIIGTLNHGKPRPDYNVWIGLASLLISLLLLTWGGFFS